MFFNVGKNREKLITMFEMQAELNANSGIENATIDDIKLAIRMECAEAIDHMEWKWWKKQKNYNKELAIKRVSMELVDVWHFIMSFQIKEIIDSGAFDNYAKDSLLEIIELISLSDPYIEFKKDEIEVLYFLMKHPTNLVVFAESCFSIGLDFDDLYLLYLAKNTLNKFRQDNAYRAKDGVEYVKMWGDGLEDNDYLFELAEGMKRCVSMPQPNEIKSLFYDALQAKYDDVLRSRNG